MTTMATMAVMAQGEKMPAMEEECLAVRAVG
jgi:hypothetical protein